MRCIICGNDKEEKYFSKEHIIPEALGNKGLCIFSVCKECNNKLGDHVDTYFTNHNLIKIIRQQRNLYGKKNKPIKIFEGTMSGDDGKQYDFRNDGYHIHPTISKTTNGWMVKTENPEDGLKVLRKKLQREGKNIDNLADKVRIEKKTVNPPVIPLNADIDTGRWILFFVKIAYEFAFTVLGEKYFDDNIAKIFRTELFQTVYNGKCDHEVIKPYVSFNSQSIDFMHQIKECNNAGLTTMHAILFHISDNSIFCHISLFLEDALTFCVVASNDAGRYEFQGNKIVMVNDIGKVLSI